MKKTEKYNHLLKLNKNLRDLSRAEIALRILIRARELEPTKFFPYKPNSNLEHAHNNLRTMLTPTYVLSDAVTQALCETTNITRRVWDIENEETFKSEALKEIAAAGCLAIDAAPLSIWELTPKGRDLKLSIIPADAASSFMMAGVPMMLEHPDAPDEDELLPVFHPGDLVCVSLQLERKGRIFAVSVSPQDREAALMAPSSLMPQTALPAGFHLMPAQSKASAQITSFKIAKKPGTFLIWVVVVETENDDEVVLTIPAPILERSLKKLTPKEFEQIGADLKPFMVRDKLSIGIVKYQVA